ncbi:hypothetical protein [Geomicrobium sp. JCM 19038]|uniref:hypothetical protein n=1 Tax=Geomicrobium sp. JCM 19038 TaxID=1460635 RepID=UPI00045F2EC2|nr:hypothetical protein [Geomicrobium sp. JCM 19038]GAK09007.1 hypothetical protein JCM19038_2817 [Geomicrobium sp. JCM 19038]
MSNVDVFNFENLRRGDSRNFTVRSGANIKRATIFYEGVSTSENSAERISNRTGPIVSNDIASTGWTTSLFIHQILPSPYTTSDVLEVSVSHMAELFHIGSGASAGRSGRSQTLLPSQYGTAIATNLESTNASTNGIRVNARPNATFNQLALQGQRSLYARTEVTVTYRGDLRNPRIIMNGSTLGAYTGTINDGDTISRSLAVDSLLPGSNGFEFNPTGNNGRSNVRIEIEYVARLEIHLTYSRIMVQGRTLLLVLYCLGIITMIWLKPGMISDGVMLEKIFGTLSLKTRAPQTVCSRQGTLI